MKYIVLILIIIGTGCQSSKEVQPKIIDEIIPALEKENNLLFVNPTLARKSITIKDYTVEESC
tara:strand:- start:270 stop:458 length:189 start_codon:yes stop_codon:yes gene_type:complete